MLPMRSLACFVLLLSSCGGPEPNTRSKDPFERYLGVREIGRNRELAAEPELVRLLDDPHYLVVTGVLESMAEIGRREYLPYATPRLKADHPWVRAQACETLATIAGEEVLEQVLGVLQQDPDPAVRRAAVKTIAVHYGKLPRARQILAQTVGDPDPSIALMAHNRLAEITGRQDVPRSKEAWAQVIQP